MQGADQQSAPENLSQNLKYDFLIDFYFDLYSINIKLIKRNATGRKIYFMVYHLLIFSVIEYYDHKNICSLKIFC